MGQKGGGKGRKGRGGRGKGKGGREREEGEGEGKGAWFPHITCLHDASGRMFAVNVQSVSVQHLNLKDHQLSHSD